MGKGKSTGHLVQLLWEPIKLKDNCGRIAHKFQSTALKQALWGINFIAQLWCGLWFNREKPFCFTTYFKDADHMCCSEVWYVSLTLTAWSSKEGVFFSLLSFLSFINRGRRKKNPTPKDYIGKPPWRHRQSGLTSQSITETQVYWFPAAVAAAVVTVWPKHILFLVLWSSVPLSIMHFFADQNFWLSQQLRGKTVK